VSEHIDLRDIMRSAGGYAPEAYVFLRDGLAHTVAMVHGEDAVNEPPAEDESRHVSGQQLCMGLRDYAIQRYGLLAKPVLTRWGITRTEDFGNIVFALVDAQLMRKTDEDTIEDFRGVFDFDEAFGFSLQDSIGTADA